jgi:hypothetical protein
LLAPYPCRWTGPPRLRRWLGTGPLGGTVYFEEIRVFNAGMCAVNILAWNDEKRLGQLFPSVSRFSNSR